MPPAGAAVLEQGETAGRGTPPAGLRVQPELHVPQGRLPQPAGAEGHDVQHQGGWGKEAFGVRWKKMSTATASNRRACRVFGDSFLERVSSRATKVILLCSLAVLRRPVLALILHQ